MAGIGIDDLEDHTVQGIWEAHLRGQIARRRVLDDTIVRSAGVLAEKGYWMWMNTFSMKSFEYALMPGRFHAD
jgi:hypothetical protein